MPDIVVSPLSPRQDMSIRESTARVNIWEGSIRSGKTIASIIRWLIFITMAPAGGELVMIGRTRDTVWRNVIAPMQDPGLFGPIANAVVGNYGAPTVRVLGRTVHVLGAHDAKAEKIIRGMTVAGAYVDELTVIGEEFFTQLLGRMSPVGASLFGTTNPDNPAHWLKKKFLDRLASLPDWRRFHFTLGDNPSLAAAYVESIKREFTGLWYRRFILGEWVQAEGAVYESWDPARHVIKAADVPAMDRILALGIDYGTTNATAGLLLGIANTPAVGNRLYVLDEWAPPRLTDAGFSHHLRTWLGSRQPPEWGSPQWVFVDPAAASFKLQLFTDGMSNVANGANNVLPGIRTIASLLATNRIQVSDTCTHLIEEIPGYVWDAKATDKGIDQPVKKNDHFSDGLRYAVHTSRQLWDGLIPLNTPIELEEAA